MRFVLAILATNVLCLMALSGSATAATCSASLIEARGEQSKFIWLAKTKARANWRSKVRQTPGLGPKFSVWAQADNTDERCLTGPAGSVCIFTGQPCSR